MYGGECVLVHFCVNELPEACALRCAWYACVRVCLIGGPRGVGTWWRVCVGGLKIQVGLWAS